MVKTRSFRIVRAIVLASTLGLSLFPLGILPMVPRDVAQAGPLIQSGVDPNQSPCVVEIRQRARPELLLLGESTTLSIAVKPTCPGETPPTHIVLLLDASGSMAGGSAQQQKAAVRSFIQALDLPAHAAMRVGVVSVNNNALTLCELSNDPDLLEDCVGALGSKGGTSIDRGIGEATEVLARGRGLAAGTPIHEIMVVLADGANNDGCAPVSRAGQKARAQGILLVPICVGSSCDVACMRSIASTPEVFFVSASAAGILTVFRAIERDILSRTGRFLSLSIELAPGVELLTGSVEPPASIRADGRVLEWSQEIVNAAGITYTLDVVPRDSGWQQLTVSSVVDFRDVLNGSRTIEVPPAWVSVFGPFLRP